MVLLDDILQSVEHFELIICSWVSLGDVSIIQDTQYAQAQRNVSLKKRSPHFNGIFTFGYVRMIRTDRNYCSSILTDESYRGNIRFHFVLFFSKHSIQKNQSEWYRLWFMYGPPQEQPFAYPMGFQLFLWNSLQNIFRSLKNGSKKMLSVNDLASSKSNHSTLL